MPKINDDMKKRILDDFKQGMSQRALANKNNISLGSINKIVSGNHKTSVKRKGSRPDGSVYLIYFENKNSIYLKIGVATDIGMRINNLQTGNPFTLILLHAKYFKNAYNIERDMHNLFIDFKFKNEWFCVTKEILINIKEKLEDL